MSYSTLMAYGYEGIESDHLVAKDNSDECT